MSTKEKIQDLTLRFEHKVNQILKEAGKENVVAICRVAIHFNQERVDLKGSDWKKIRKIADGIRKSKYHESTLKLINLLEAGEGDVRRDFLHSQGVIYNDVERLRAMIMREGRPYRLAVVTEDGKPQRKKRNPKDRFLLYKVKEEIIKVSEKAS